VCIKTIKLLVKALIRIVKNFKSKSIQFEFFLIWHCLVSLLLAITAIIFLWRLILEDFDGIMGQEVIVKKLRKKLINLNKNNDLLP